MTSVFKRLAIFAVATTAFTAQPSWASDTANSSPSSQLELENCFVEGISSHVKCGQLLVPENRAIPASDDNQISVNVVVLPKFKEESTELPIIFLAGGPGQASTELAGMMGTMMSSLRQQHDIVFVDQRGTGKSNALSCDMPSVEPLSFDDTKLNIEKEVQDCIASLNKFHLPSYNSIEHIKDLEAVREALNYSQFHVFGGSYGTRAGFTYLQQFPTSVKTAVLDSNAPMQLVIGLFGKTSERAFDMLVDDCNNTPQCQASFPTLKEDYIALMSEIRKAPISVDMFHPVTGNPTTFVMTESKVTETLRSLLYSLGSRAMLPYIVNRAANGDRRALAAMVGRYRDSERQPGQLYTGLTMNILCNEDVPRLSAAEIENDANNYVTQNSTFESLAGACEYWPRWEVEADFNKPLETSVPVLLFSGEYDPVTPPEYGEMAIQTLENAKHVVIKQAAHVASFNMCIETIDTFIKSGTFEELDFSCADEQRKMMFLVDQNQIK